LLEALAEAFKRAGRGSLNALLDLIPKCNDIDNIYLFIVYFSPDSYNLEGEAV
jgi:hypothetical protein